MANSQRRTRVIPKAIAQSIGKSPIDSQRTGPAETTQNATTAAVRTKVATRTHLGVQPLATRRPVAAWDDGLSPAREHVQYPSQRYCDQASDHKTDFSRRK